MKIYLNNRGTCWVNGNAELPHFYHLVDYFAIKAWGKQIKEGKITKEEPPAVIAVCLLAKTGAIGGSSSGSSKGGQAYGPGGYF